MIDPDRKPIQPFQMTGSAQFGLFEVTDADLVNGANPAASDYIWRYVVTPIKMSFAGISGLPTFANITTTPVSFYAFSISEMNNMNNIYAFGIPAASLPATFTPVRIPNGTPVIAVPIRLNDTSAQVWIILNTQAVDGACA